VISDLLVNVPSSYLVVIQDSLALVYTTIQEKQEEI
jgi:hypothetical protein